MKYFYYLILVSLIIVFPRISNASEVGIIECGRSIGYAYDMSPDAVMGEFTNFELTKKRGFAFAIDIETGEVALYTKNRNNNWSKAPDGVNVGIIGQIDVNDKSYVKIMVTYNVNINHNIQEIYIIDIDNSYSYAVYTQSVIGSKFINNSLLKSECKIGKESLD